MTAALSLAELLPVVERMARLAERAGGIIQRVNAFARRRELLRQQLGSGGVVAACAGAVWRRQQCHAPAWALPDHPVWVEADELLFEHLVNNLVGNAQDWAPHGGQRAQVWVGLRVDQEQGMAVLSVADTGPGVGEEAQATIFNAFVSSKEGGMGMGLAICRSIVEAHHGSIEVSRDPVLGGACFTVKLPLAKTRTSKETAMTHPRVHIVDDDPDIRDGLAWLFDSRGFQERHLGRRPFLSGGGACLAGGLGPGGGVARHAHGAAVGKRHL